MKLLNKLEEKMKFKINKNIFKKSILESGLTITQIAEQSKLSRHTIHRILSTECTVTSSTVGRLAKALDLSVEKLIS